MAFWAILIAAVGGIAASILDAPLSRETGASIAVSANELRQRSRFPRNHDFIPSKNWFAGSSKFSNP